MWIVIAQLLLAAAAAAQPDVPAATYEWVGDCPAACCGYGAEWTLMRDSPAWADPAGPEVRMRREAPAFVVGRGERVRAVTGVLQALEPGRARVRRDFSTDATYASLSTRHRQTITFVEGEEVPLLAPRGGRDWRIWRRGRVLDAHLYAMRSQADCSRNGCDAVIVSEPLTRWWVMIVTSRGDVGWIDAAAAVGTPSCR